MRMHFVLAFSLFCVTLSLFAKPSIEALFRNSANMDVPLNGAELNFIVEAVKSDSALESGLPTTKRFYLKELVDLGGKGSLLEVKSISEDFSKEIISVSPIRDLSVKGEVVVATEKLFFYSFIQMLYLNQSGPLSRLVKSSNPSFKKSTETVNEEKRRLLGDYRTYLQTGDKTAKSPLAPDSFNAQEQMAKLVTAPLYLPTEQPILTRENGHSFWNLKLDATEAKFSTGEYLISSFMHKTSKTQFQLEFFDYIKRENGLWTPSFITFASSDGSEWKVTLQSIKYFEKATTFSIKDDYSQRPRTTLTVVKAPFLL